MNNINEKNEQLYQLTTLVAGRFTLQEVLDRLAEAAVKITAVKACSIRLLDEEEGQLKMRSTYGLSEKYRNKGNVSIEDPVIKEAFAGKAVIIDDMGVDDRVKYKQASINEGIVSQLTVVMQFREKSIGVLRLYSPKPKRFNEEDIGLSRAVASQCAVAITNAKLYWEALEGSKIAEQVKLAGDIQRRMIPSNAPKIKNLDISATYIPCFEVGGDFYDFIKLSDSKIVITISDVIGKGVPAALMMSGFRAALRAYVYNSVDENVAKIVDQLNKMACRECRPGEFITLFLAIIDTEKMSITYCSCGHEPTILIRDGKMTDLTKGGLVLGVEPDIDYEIETVDLKADDWLIFYTDGLIDAPGFDGELWGRENLLKAVENFVNESSKYMINDILRYRRRFVGLARQMDDTSIVAVKVLSE